jgi:hypothetical protein
VTAASGRPSTSGCHQVPAPRLEQTHQGSSYAVNVRGHDSSVNVRVNRNGIQFRYNSFPIKAFQEKSRKAISGKDITMLE